MLMNVSVVFLMLLLSMSARLFLSSNSVVAVVFLVVDFLLRSS